MHAEAARPLRLGVQVKSAQAHMHIVQHIQHECAPEQNTHQYQMTTEKMQVFEVKNKAEWKRIFYSSHAREFELDRMGGQGKN